MFKSFLLLCFLTTLSLAQNLPFGEAPPSTFTLVGSVRDQSGQAVGGVRLTVVDENYQTVQSSFVDASGRFRVSGLRMGKYVVRIETTGTPYDEQSQQIELQSLRRAGGDETMNMEFRLTLRSGAGPITRGGAVFAQAIPKAARAEYERGVSALRNNKTDAAIVAFKKATSIFPDYFDALESLGVEYAKDGQYEPAVESLAHAIKVNGRAPRSLYAIGVAYMNLHRLTEAIEWLGKAAQLDPNSSNIQMMLGMAYGNGGALDKSEAAFNKALQLGGPAAAEAHFYLAGLFNKQGKFHEAGQELESFLKESKNVKDPAQIKSMIEKLKEKEKAGPAQLQTARASSASSVNLSSDPSSPSRGNQAQSSTDTQHQTNNQSTVQAESTEAERSPRPDESSSPAPENSALLSNPIQPLPPESAEILKQSEPNGGRMHKQLLDYTYTLKKTRRVLDARGNPVSAEEQVFEAYPVRGEHVLIRLSSNGIPSTSLAEDRKRAVKQLEEAERQQPKLTAADENEISGEKLDYLSAGVTGIYNKKPGYVSINVSAFLRACEFFSPRTEKIADRETLVLNFRRRAGASLPSNQTYVSKLVGTIWIDQIDKVVTRLEAWPAAQAAFDLLQTTAPRENAALIYQQQRQANGTWFPVFIRMNAGGRAELFDGLNWDVIFEFGNYQRFDASAGNVIINPASKSP
jgi:tetratricopeptide (TPR) repeat protein